MIPLSSLSRRRTKALGPLPPLSFSVYCTHWRQQPGFPSPFPLHTLSLPPPRSSFSQRASAPSFALSLCQYQPTLFPGCAGGGGGEGIAVGRDAPARTIQDRKRGIVQSRSAPPHPTIPLSVSSPLSVGGRGGEGALINIRIRRGKGKGKGGERREGKCIFTMIPRLH